MDDFDNDDFDELFNMNEDGENHSLNMDKIHRLLFIDDLEKYRTTPIPLDPNEFEDMFGKPENEDLRIMTQVLIDDVHKKPYDEVVDKWGLSWIEDLLSFNVMVEEYELCSIFKEILDISKKKLTAQELL